ncbi:MAG: succinylglutamate desuccinylase/aspartoacylase family protein [Firmicutes bacterium]|nr:succinylglutamate desuccinylase/aspartoacylase family protein [Bacillota bacterium]
MPGEKITSFFEVPGTPVKMPFTMVNGAKEGKTIVITGGTHGGEYPGAETAMRIARELDPAKVCGKVIVVHPVNMPAFMARTQYVGPLDGKNLNRVYPGKALGTVSERIAFFVRNELMAQADFYMDLHGGDIHEWLTPFVLIPMVGTPEDAEESRRAAEIFGVPFVIGSWGTGGTIGSAALLGVPGFLSEIGGRGLWSEEEVELYLRGVRNVLKLYKVIEGEPEKLCDTVWMERMTGVNASVSGCWYPSAVPEEAVKEGQKVGEIRDFFGNVLEECFCPIDGKIMYVISSLPVEEGDPIYCVGPV